MPSLQSCAIRLLPNVRKRFIDWEAPVKRFRAMMERSEPHFRPPRGLAPGLR